MSKFSKIGKGIKKATKAVGKGVANAAKYTAKNPGKILGVAAAAAGTLATAGALAPSLAPSLAATKVGGTLFGKMVTKTMGTGTVVRNKIAQTLTKKNGKAPSSKDVSIVEKGLNEEIKKRKGFKLPVDKTSKSGTEARAKLKEISSELTNRVLDAGAEKLRNTLNAERQVLIDNPETNGILSKDQVPADAWQQMQQAGPIQENIMGSTGGFLGDISGGGQIAQERAADVMDIIHGRSSDPYFAEDAAQGVKYIEAKQNQNAGIVPESVTNLIKKPIVWAVMAAGAVIYFIFFDKNKNKTKKRR